MKIDEIVAALRCISAPAGDKKANCESCPFYVVEKLDEEWREKTGADEWPGCDCDAVGFAAADLIENQQREIEALRQANRAPRMREAQTIFRPLLRPAQEGTKH